MRIIAGKAGRTRLDVPRGVTRPTTDRVREALFSIIGERVNKERVLDLFAGSGALGLEALSRGAEHAVFVERSVEACRTIEGNLERADLGSVATIRRMSAESFLKRALLENAKPYGLILADPPYRKDGIVPLLRSEGLRGVLEIGGWLILEMAVEDDPEPGPDWAVVEDRRYGGTKIMILTQV